MRYFAVVIAMCLVGCQHSKGPTSEQLAKFAVDSSRAKMADVLGDDIAQPMSIVADKESIQSFGPRKWKIMLTKKVQTDVSSRPNAERLLIEAMNGTVRLTIEEDDSGALSITHAEVIKMN